MDGEIIKVHGIAQPGPAMFAIIHYNTHTPSVGYRGLLSGKVFMWCVCVNVYASKPFHTLRASIQPRFDKNSLNEYYTPLDTQDSPKLTSMSKGNPRGTIEYQTLYRA